MKHIIVGVFIALTFLLLGCGMSDADKATAGAALGSFQSLVQPNLKRAIADARREYGAIGRCTPGSTTTSGVTVTIACPSSDSYTFTITATGPVDRTCGSETFTAKDISATFSFTVTARSTWTWVGDITATINDKALDCNWTASLNLTSGGLDVSDTGYDCTYGGSSLDATALEAAGCLT